MKIFVPFRQKILQSVFCIFIAASAVNTNAQSSTGLQTGSAAKVIVNMPANKLASFTAILNNNNKVELKWTTETETNLSHIMVEKSLDGKNFKDAALVFTYGNTTTRSDYAFDDQVSKISSGGVYYRLRSVDTNGTTQFSDTRFIEISKDADYGKTVLAYAKL
jgi:hypothetical protein